MILSTQWLAGGYILFLLTPLTMPHNPPRYDSTRH